MLVVDDLAISLVFIVESEYIIRKIEKKTKKKYPSQEYIAVVCAIYLSATKMSMSLLLLHLQLEYFS